MRTLAIDLGTRRIGLALSDEGGRFATPYDVLSVGTAEAAIPLIVEVVKKEGAQRLVVGLPLNMDDSVGEAARRTVRWGEALARGVEVPVVFVDERLSSFAAEQQLAERKRGGERMTRRDKKQRLDALAATAFLQEFLDGRLAPIDPADVRRQGGGG